ncbi:hypothetical protein [Sulfitobacter donghicola]|uniref:Uncharacterized protein n=1 Tax=Sulfitobacter donghicola DSW-25 = KCTC 12864 = JCM 14565 TaxID=1300350 RepID=A0A073IH34_9RHOB|nr:hypothetical protein [Sulfitobacter donghicola]KEJ89638.1 hypothetical protein DSW25_09645 [Sulfitobacter donghicola DSW-25 = KCTC 12864 = JCM 14565]
MNKRPSGGGHHGGVGLAVAMMFDSKGDDAASDGRAAQAQPEVAYR